MRRDELTTKTSIQMVALGLLVSTVVSLTIVAVARLLSGGRHNQGPHPGEADRTAPSSLVQPAVDTVMPAHVPDHFTEDLVLPGFTETGQDVERQDDTVGRSPEGV